MFDAFFGRTSLSGALIAATLCVSAAQAQTAASDADQAAADQGKIVLELNNATDVDGGACRMTFVATNNSGAGFARTGWQVGVFDAEGIVRSILALEFGELPASKTKIVLFDLPGRGCADISRVIVNDVTLCQPTGAADDVRAPACLEALTTRSRATIEFGV